MVLNLSPRFSIILNLLITGLSTVVKTHNVDHRIRSPQLQLDGPSRGNTVRLCFKTFLDNWVATVLQNQLHYVPSGLLKICSRGGYKYF